MCAVGHILLKLIHLAGFSLLVGVVGCSGPASSGDQNVQAPGTGCIQVTDRAPDFFPELRCLNDFKKVAGPPASFKYGNIESVKFVYRLSDSTLYFQHSTRYESHYDFCRTVMYYPESRGKFNGQEYNSQTRQYLLGSVHYYPNGPHLVMEIFPGDNMSAAHLTEMYHAVKAKVYFPDQLKLLLSDPVRRKEIAAATSIPMATPAEIFGSLAYLPMKTGTSTGILRIFDTENANFSDLRREDIVLTTTLPDDLNPVSGLITTPFQRPLSHLNVLARNFGFPNAVLTTATTNAHIRALEGRWVTLQITTDTLDIQPATASEIDAAQSKIAHGLVHQLEYDRTSSKIVDLADLSWDKSPIVGAKAANFGEIAKVQAIKPDLFAVPEGAFAIPMFWYFDHLERNNLTEKLKSALSFPVTERASHLEEIREAIKSAPVNPVLIRKVEARLQDVNAGNRFRFRSSTNAEDLAFFNGAGLYSSKTAVLNDPKKTVERALQKVWASLWNEAAWRHRAAYNLDESTIGMGVLVHRSFPAELANGVAITKNLYDPVNPGYTINVQIEEYKVVDSDPNQICDELVLYRIPGFPGFSPTLVGMDYITNSNLTDQPVMTEAEILALADALDVLDRHFNKIFRKKRLKGYALDVEFKLDTPDRKLYIKQARPYK